MTAKILVLLTGLATTAKDCGPAYFEQPQPDGSKNLKHIPARFQGTYSGFDDSVRLEITDRIFLLRRTNISSVARNGPDAAELAYIKGDTAFCETNGCWDFKLLGDSIRIVANYTDTLIYISDNEGIGVMRKYGKYYFLNKENFKQKWGVNMVELNNNELTVSSTYAEEDMAYLRKQLKTSDSTDIFNPSRTQFKQFVKEGGFRNKEKFKKL